MELLESAMAFAIVMILLSTIVTGIVELLLRIVGLREKTLRNTVVSLFENVVWPRLEARLTEENVGSDDAKKKVRADFLKGMTANPAFVAPPVEEEAKPSWWRFAWLPNLSHKDSIDVLTPLTFAQRLARTEVGQAIVAEGKQELELLVQDFVRTFDRYGRAASEVFRKNAKLVAVAVGILFALIANVDAGRLFTALMNNPDLRTSLIDNVDEAVEANEKAVESLKQVADQITAGSLTDDQAKAIESKIAEIESGIGALTRQGMPIGYSYYPYCREGVVGDPDCRQADRSWAWLIKVLRWLFFSLLAGVLIGLGGPFWFRVFSSLSQIFQVLRSLGVGSKPKQAKPEELDALPSAEESAKPKDVIDAFTVAAHVHAKGSAGQSALIAGAPQAGRRFID